MLISHRYKFIFFSFPKTGSESVRKLLDPFSDIRGIPFWKTNQDEPFYSHISPLEVENIFKTKGWRYDEYYKFTFVRNPWARLVSLYNMIYFTRKPSTFVGKIKSMIRKTSVPSFKEWLYQTKPGGEGAGGPPDQRWQVYGSYSIANYILDESGNELVNEVIKLEDIDQKLPELLERLNIPDSKRLEIPHINKRTAKNYSNYYDDESNELVFERYKYDIDRFHYRFDE